MPYDAPRARAALRDQADRAVSPSCAAGGSGADRAGGAAAPPRGRRDPVPAGCAAADRRSRTAAHPGRSRSVAAVLAAASTIVDVTIGDLRAAAQDPSRPLADRDRSELATVVVRVTPRAAHELVRRLRELLEAALRLDGSGTEQVRLTLAVVPVTRPAKL